MRIGREILQKAADVVVRIVAAVDREHVVESGTAAEGDRGNARLGGVGRLDRLGSRDQVGDVGEAAHRQRNCCQILRGDYAAMYGAAGIHGLGDDGRCLRLHIQRLLSRGRL